MTQVQDATNPVARTGDLLRRRPNWRTELLEKASTGELPYAERLVSNPHDDKAHVDLKTACAVQLELCGVEPDQIYVSDACTMCRNDVFPSYRKEGARAGRILSVVGKSV